MNHTIEILKGARKLLADKPHWIQGMYARDYSGQPVHPASSSARCWCLVGALVSTGYCLPCASGRTKAAAALVTEALPPSAGGSIPAFNDDERTTHADVLRVLDIALAKALEEEMRAI